MNEGALPDNKKYEKYKAGIMGAELRFWLGPLFVGVHGGQYFLTWIESLSSYTGTNWSGGTGFGLDLKSFTVKIVRRLILKIPQISEWKETE